ncbi:MAG: helix-turn-helix transcriptional regulator [Burkholderiales bacterium]|nr:helix-turn-helix transcriptional regulator [Burkholderiales bacterium]
MSTIQSDQEFFYNFVASSKTVFDYIGDNVHIKDHEFKYKYASPSYLTFFNKIYGFEKQAEDLLGQTLKEVIDRFGLNKRNLYEDLTKQEEEIKSTRKSTRLVQAVANYPQVCVVFKRPIINPASDNFVGIMTHFSTLAMPNILKTLLKVNRKSSYIINNDSNYNHLEYNLTERQHIVLFLYLHRYSAAEIASILGTLDYKMSNSRINDHLEALKFIFRVKTKDQLIEKALAMDYDLLIPRALLKEGSYPLDEAISII